MTKVFVFRVPSIWFGRMANLRVRVQSASGSCELTTNNNSGRSSGSTGVLSFEATGEVTIQCRSDEACGSYWLDCTTVKANGDQPIYALVGPSPWCTFCSAALFLPSTCMSSSIRMLTLEQVSREQFLQAVSGLCSDSDLATLEAGTPAVGVPTAMGIPVATAVVPVANADIKVVEMQR